jgi:hypothetical protein
MGQKKSRIDQVGFGKSRLSRERLRLSASQGSSVDAHWATRKNGEAAVGKPRCWVNGSRETLLSPLSPFHLPLLALVHACPLYMHPGGSLHTMGDSQDGEAAAIKPAWRFKV